MYGDTFFYDVTLMPVSIFDDPFYSTSFLLRVAYFPHLFIYFLVR